MEEDIEKIEKLEREYYERMTGNKANEMVKLGIMRVSENNPKRFIILCEEEYAKMREYIGPIMIQISKEYAKSIAPFYKDMIDNKLEVIKLVFATITSLTGWGVFDFPQKNEDGSYTVKVYNSFEANIANKRKEQIQCTFTLGFIKGLFESVFNKKVVVKEVKTETQNNNYCEFKIILE